MKTYITVLLLGYTISCKAQITLAQSDVFILGSYAITAKDTNIITMQGNSGENQVWNLSTLKNQKIDTTYVLQTSSTPAANLFTTSNVALRSSSNYIYYNTNANFIDYQGSYNLGSSPPYINLLSPPITYIKFPATYNTSFSGTTNYDAISYYPSPPYDSAKFSVTLNYSELIDGWGTLITPLGSYNTLRERKINNSTAKEFLHIKSGIWVSTSTNTNRIDTVYNWWAKNLSSPVATISKNIGTYLLSLNVGIANIDDESIINIYPNPSNGKFAIETDNMISHIDIINAIGENIYTESHHNNKSYAQIDLSFLPRGNLFHSIKAKQLNSRKENPY